MNVASLASYLLMCFLVAASPGPGMMSVISYGTALGVRGTTPFIFGIQLGLLALSLATFAGIGALLAANPMGFRLLQFAGAAYIAYLGVRTLLSGKIVLADIGESDSWRSSLFFEGFLVSVANPKSIVFFTSFFPLFLRSDQPLAAQAATLVALLLACTAGVHLVYAYVSYRLSDRIDRYANGMKYVIGLGLIAVAIASAR